MWLVDVNGDNKLFPKEQSLIKKIPEDLYTMHQFGVNTSLCSQYRVWYCIRIGVLIQSELTEITGETIKFNQSA